MSADYSVPNEPFIYTQIHIEHDIACVMRTAALFGGGGGGGGVETDIEIWNNE